jgi:hypothetical protein
MMITLVPKEHVSSIWKQVAPEIEKALQRGEGRYDIVDVYEDILTGAQTLWLAVDKIDGKPEIVGVCTVRIVKYPKFRACRLENVAGENFDTWMNEGLRIIGDYAKELGCDRLEAEGRYGWERKLEKAGWKKFTTSVEYKFPINEDQEK